MTDLLDAARSELALAHMVKGVTDAAIERGVEPSTALSLVVSVAAGIATRHLGLPAVLTLLKEMPDQIELADTKTREAMT